MSSIFDKLPAILDRILKEKREKTGEASPLSKTPPLSDQSLKVGDQNTANAEDTGAVATGSDTITTPSGMELFNSRPRRVDREKLIWVMPILLLYCRAQHHHQFL